MAATSNGVDERTTADPQAEPAEAAQPDKAMQAADASEVALAADDGGSTDGEADSFYEYLATEYRRFRLLTWVFGICGFSLILVAVSLNQTGVMSLGIYNIVMSVAYFAILLMAITIFTRTRPFKRRMKEYSGEPISNIRDDSAPDGVKMEDPKFRDMDDVYKILERDIRTEVIPEMPEYRKLRRLWLGLMGAAALIALASLVMYYLRPEWGLISSFILLTAFILVIVAFYVDRTRMKPLRNAWAKQYGMTEMQMRDNLRAIREGKYEKKEA